jgi:uncharacterized protein YabN with tetrapyrrole methylase and pyrophosphatase domain
VQKGRLTLVGTGYNMAGQVTVQALSCLKQAEKLFFLVSDGSTSLWLRDLNPTAESLYDAYAVGEERIDAYHRMVARILDPVRRGVNVCAAFYGHPGVLVYPAHEAIRQARSEGYEARMLPGVSAVDCLFADLGLDPATDGCQMYEATNFLYRQRRFDPRSPLILWQIGNVGVSTYLKSKLWGPEGLRVLQEVLLRDYPAVHEVVIYETRVLPISPPKILRVPLRNLADSDVTGHSTLLVPPLGGEPDYDWDLVERLAPSQP